MENAGKATAAESSRDIFHRLVSEDPSGKQTLKSSQLNFLFCVRRELICGIDCFCLGGWEKTWEAGATPWDLGKPTPIIVNLVETGSLPKGRALVPGCGTVCASILFCL